MSLDEITLILGMAAVTFGLRFPALALISRINLPHRIRRALQFVPPVVLSAIIFPAVLIHDDHLNFQIVNARLYASLISALVAWRTRNLLLTIIFGMGTFFLWEWLTF